MKRLIYSARDLVISVIDFFYPPFKRLMDLQTFRYAACGGGNTLLGLLVYAMAYKYLFREENFHFGFYAFKPHVAALFLSGCINFLIGFLLMKYIVFRNSFIKGYVQLFRYLAVYLFNLMLNYILLKVFVERLHIYPVLAQVINTCIMVLLSYLMQKHYTFKTEPKESKVN